MRVMVLVAAVMAVSSTSPAKANDSAAEIGIGGLTLLQSDSITLDREELFVSAKEVRVDYEFTNTSEQSQTVLVAFPLPDLNPMDGELGDRSTPNYANDLDFRTVVDGKNLELKLVQQAFFKGKEITARLAELGLPMLDAAADDAFNKAINGMDSTFRDKLLQEEWIREVGVGANDVKYWGANWTIKTSVTREQLFPARQTIRVQHRYKPLAGGSIGGSLEPQSRNQEFAQAQIRKYCVEPDWLKSFDREGRKRGGSTEGSYPHSETWLRYVLSSGANWKGPIGEFRLVVDKGHASNMVSFCATGVKKISPTTFEVRYKNYEPRNDLDILIINWAR
jgi:hypothetical protein